MFPKNGRSGASRAVVVALLCCAAFAARAGEKTELTTELNVEQDYDSNIFYTDKNPRGSALTVIRPSLNFENTGTLGHARFYGFVSEHVYWSESKLSGFDRGFGGELSRRIFPKTTIFGSGSYQRLAAHLAVRGADVVTTTGGQAGVPGQTVIQPGELIEGSIPDVDLGQGTFGVKQELSPRTELQLSGGPWSIDYLEDGTGLNQWRDRSGWYADLGLNHLLTPLDRVSFDLVATNTDFSDAFSGPVTVNEPGNVHAVNLNTGNTTSEQQSVQLSWTRNWSELWSTTVAIGGRRLHTRTTDALRPLTRLAVSGGTIVAFVDYAPVAFSDTGPGAVGELSIQRLLPRGSVSLSYSRETRTTSSLFASNVNVDTIQVYFLHRLAPHVNFTLNAFYEHYESVNNNTQFFPAQYQEGSFNPITGPVYSCPLGFLVQSGSGIGTTGQCRISNRSALHSDLYTAVARIDWQLYRRLGTFLVFRYQDRNGDELLFGQNYDKFNVGVGFKYDYALPGL